ncbi:hypothetical protein KIH41_17345 [Litoribacter ruber]|uniref:hypothetical protein n=1 Tax=Litoribacter ruber TaxID=702568 RepID=UPI001BDB3438|nr:hypothetical protein [Litoribacter ruber]MBT0813057.1 hypothetical protein [Litoribacter ruber]
MKKIFTFLMALLLSVNAWGQKVKVDVNESQKDSLHRVQRTRLDSLGTSPQLGKLSVDSLRRAGDEVPLDTIKNIQHQLDEYRHSMDLDKSPNVPDVPTVDQLEEHIEGAEHVRKLKDKAAQYKKISQPDIPNFDSPVSPKVLSKEELGALTQKLGQNENLSKMKTAGKGNVNKATIENKQSLKDRIFFEGLFTWIPGDITRFSISPAIGANIIDKFSVGAGPNILFQQTGAAPPSVDVPNFSRLGFRPFIKYDVLPQRVYLQAESLTHRRLAPPELVAIGREPARLYHQVGLGGGCLVRITQSSAINIMALYQVGGSFFNDSPIMIRVGLSSLNR